MMMLFLFLMACAKPNPPASTGQNGKIGVQYRRVEDGMLVTKVIPGMSAEAAGLLPGDLLLEVDGEPVFDGNRNRIAGPPQTEITITVQSPYQKKHRTVTLERRGAIKSRVVSVSQKKAYDFLSQPADARMLWLNQPDNAFDNYFDQREFWLQIIKHAKLDDWSESELQDLAKMLPSLAELERLQQRFPASDLLSDNPLSNMKDTVLWSSDIRPMRTTGWPMLEWRELLNQWEAAQHTSTEPTTELLDAIRLGAQKYHWGATQLGAFGMAAYSPQNEWGAPTPPLDLPEIELLNQDRWSWQSDGLTVVNLWATWCGPCRKEMPEFVELSKAFPEQKVRFIAISTDKMTDRDKVDAMVDEWGLPFSVAHEPSMNRSFEVTGIPAIRVLNAEGQLVYSRKGYSASAMTELRAKIEELLDNPKPIEQRLAYSLERSQIPLEAFLSVPDIQSLSSHNEQLWISRRQNRPVPLSLSESSMDSRSFKDYHPNAQITFDPSFGKGPVTADIGGHLIRAYDDTGAPTWFQTTAAPILKIQAVDSWLYVHTERSVLVFNADGQLEHQLDGACLDIARATEGIWVLTENKRLRLKGDEILEEDSRPDGAVYLQADGGMRQALYAQSLLGSNADSQDSILYRAKMGDLPAAVLWSNGSASSQTLFLTGSGHQIGLWDSNEDGDPELVIAFPNMGVAVFRLMYDK